MGNKLPGLGRGVATVKMHRCPGLVTLVFYLLGGQAVSEQVHQGDFNNMRTGQLCSVLPRRKRVGCIFPGRF